VEWGKRHDIRCGGESAREYECQQLTSSRVISALTGTSQQHGGYFPQEEGGAEWGM